nr:hypothetical protein [Tanacetum cinerariifolium]
MSLLQEALDAYATLTRRVEHLEYDKVTQALEITKLKKRVKKLKKENRERIIDELDKDDDVALMDDKEEDKKEEEDKVVENDQEDKLAEVQEYNYFAVDPQVPAATITTAPGKVAVAPAKVAAAPSRRKKGVVIKDPKKESTTSSIIPADTKSKDKGKGIIVEEPKPLKKKQQIEMDKEYARKLHAELNKYIDWDVAINHVNLKAKEDLTNVVGFILDYFKGMSYVDIRPIFEAKFNSNVDFLLKTKEQMEKEESRALQIINQTPAQKAAKKRKLNKEVEKTFRDCDLSTHITKYTSRALTQKVFANTRRVRKGFLGVKTPLFEGMVLVGEIQEQGDAEEQGRMTDVLMVDKEDEKKIKKAMGASDDQVKGRQAEIYKIDIDHASKVLSMQEDEPEVQAVVDKKQQVKMNEEYARKLHTELNKDIDWYKDIDWNAAIDHVKQRGRIRKS